MQFHEKSVKQSTIASSTTHARFIAWYKTTIQVVWVRNFIVSTRMMELIEKLIQIWCDNNSTVFVSRNNKRSASTKHLELKHLIVKEKIKQGCTRIDHIDTESIISYPLNRALANIDFHRHANNKGMFVSFDVLN